MTTYYSVKRYSSQPIVMARLFVVTGSKGVRAFERQSLNSPELAHLPKGAVFHGEWAGAWVKRLKSEGGGYCFSAAVSEVL